MGAKVLVIGIDAMDPKIVEAIIEKLPNFKRLEYARLETTTPPETPVAWSAASTGSNPGRYGIFDFMRRDTESYLPKLNLAIEKPGVVKTEYQCAMMGTPFWRVLTKKGIPSTVIRWPVTFPPEPVKGRMLSGLGVVDLKSMLNSYSFYTDELLQDSEGKEKVIQVKVNDNVIETYISGLLIRKKKGVQDLRVPMRITLKEDGVVVNVNDTEYSLKPKQWSRMIRVKFKIYVSMEVYGICNLYLESIKPFRMYMSSVQIDPENQFLPITYPKEYGNELVNSIGLFYTLGMPEDTKVVTENKLNESVFLEQIGQIEKEREKMFWYEFERFKEGAYAFVFDAGDRLQHIFWKEVKQGNKLDIPKEIEDYYIKKDRFIGEVMSRLDEDTKLIVLSDHGFSTFKRQVNINSWLVEEGYMRVTKREGSLFKFVDWDNTKAYSLGFTSLYLNLKGREGKGIVEEKEKEGLIDEIITKLGKIKDGNKPVFTSVCKGLDIYHGEYTTLAPDIVLGFAPGYRMAWKSAIGQLDDEVIFDNQDKWRADHLIDRSHVPGVLFTNFKINKKNPSIIDIAPTVLKMFDVEIPEGVDGESLV
jgi:predicted AlkP superfamily phosphohydrolase/phosphomutase